MAATRRISRGFALDFDEILQERELKTHGKGKRIAKMLPRF